MGEVAGTDRWSIAQKAELVRAADTVSPKHMKLFVTALTRIRKESDPFAKAVLVSVQ